MLRVVGGDGQADLHAGFEAAVGGEHHKGWRLEGVIRRQQDAAVVDATLWWDLCCWWQVCHGGGCVLVCCWCCRYVVCEASGVCMGAKESMRLGMYEWVRCAGVVVVAS